MVIVTLAWVFFRSPDISSGFRYIGHLFGIGADGFIDGAFFAYIRSTYVVLILSVIGTTPLLGGLFHSLEEQKAQLLEWIWLLLIFVLSTMEIIASSYNPFIYFNF